jgi:hypothetical protein
MRILIGDASLELHSLFPNLSFPEYVNLRYGAKVGHF